MKKKDLIYLILAVVILLVAGYVAYTQVFAQKSTAAARVGTEVPVVGDIPASFDQSALDIVIDQTKVKDFSPPYDLSGLNNTAPFGK